MNKISDKCPVEVFPVAPNIEKWMMSGLNKQFEFKDKMNLRKVSLEIEFDIERAKNNNKDFCEFIEKLQKYQCKEEKND